MNYGSFVQAVIVAFLTGGAFSFLQFLITRHDKKNDRIAELEKKFDKKFDELESKMDVISSKQDAQEMHQVRSQLLLLMADYPTENAEIMKLGEHYFSTLKGDWYLTNLFNSWIEKRNLGKPEWFNNRHEV